MSETSSLLMIRVISTATEGLGHALEKLVGKGDWTVHLKRKDEDKGISGKIYSKDDPYVVLRALSESPGSIGIALRQSFGKSDQAFLRLWSSELREWRNLSAHGGSLAEIHVGRAMETASHLLELLNQPDYAVLVRSLDSEERDEPTDEDRQLEATLRLAAKNGQTQDMYELGLLLERKGDSDGAEEWYSRASKALGEPVATANIGWLWMQRGQPDRALPYFTRAAEAGDAYSMEWLAQFAERRGDYKLAEQLLYDATRKNLQYKERWVAVLKELGLSQDWREFERRKERDEARNKAREIFENVNRPVKKWWQI